MPRSLTQSEVDSSLPSTKYGNFGLFKTKWRIKVFGIEMPNCHSLA